MKKLSIALALILCLVMVVFCFAACGKKKGDATTADQGTTPEATTAPKVTEPEATEPEVTEHQHTQGTEYVIDIPATCGAAGSKSYHCTVCNEIIPETVVAIPATGNHTLGEWVETTAPTVVSDGVKTKTCSVCGQKINEAIAKTAATVKTFNDEAGSFDDEKLNIKTDVLKGAHFYPTADNPEGNDLLVEYSILWNDSMLNLLGSAKPYFHTCVGKENGTEEINNIVYWSPVSDNSNADCKFAGGFEYGTMRTSEEGNPYPKMTLPVGDTINSFPNIGGANMGDGQSQSFDQWGWHRVQIRLHVEVTNAAALKADEAAGATAATYKCTTTIYIDGILVSILSSDSMTNGSVSFDNKLFTAESDGQGGIVYADVRDEAWIHALRLNSTQAKKGKTVYLAYGDVSMTCGKEFVQKVIKAVDPADATIEVADGVTKSAKAWYKLFDAASHEHVWNEEVEVTKAATLIENGTRVMKCAFCEATQTVEYAYSPIVRRFTKDTKTSYSPYEASLGTIRGDKHFYEAGNDLLVEYSFLWNETTANLRGDKNPFIDTRLTNSQGKDSKNIIYWSPVPGISYSDCQYAGGFEYGGIDLSMPDNPYPGFNSGVNDGDLYPNIGGENNGGGTEQTNTRYGWHRVSIRYRNEVTNKAALMADTTAGATAATYNLELWVYIDGVLVVHAYQTDRLADNGDDRKLFSAESNGNGGIVYTENDDLILKPVFLNSNRAKDGKYVYYSLADVSVTVGSEFKQNVIRVDNPTAAQLVVDTDQTVTSTIWYAKPCAEHTWDGNFTVERAATVIRDGVKVEHCSVCGAAHLVDVPFEIQVYDSKNPSGPYATDTSFAYNETIASIRGDKSFAPTADDDDGNDLWFEYSFLWNDSLYYRDTSDNRAELRIFGFRDMAGWKNYRGFYYLYTRNNNDGFATSSDCPYAGHIDFSTYYLHASPAQNCADDLGGVDKLNGRAIGRYIAGWGGGRNDSPYLWDSKYQTMGGWHRLGFRYHQEVASVEGSTVSYAGYTELYIDGVLCWRVHTNFDPASNDSLNKKGLLLWTATAEDGVITGYTNNDTIGVEFRIDNITGSSRSVFIALDDIQTNCGDGFVHPVVRVENPKPVKITLPDGEEYDGAKYFTYAHDHFWDEDYTVTVEPTMTSKGKKIDHCVVCGETRETVMDETEPVVLDGTLASAPSGWGYNQNMFSDREELKTIAEREGSFYPTEGNDEGNDLLVEFSILWNQTLDQGESDACVNFGRFDKKGGNPAYTTIWLHLGTCTDCPFLGGLELNTGSGTVKFGPDNSPIHVDHPEEFANIGSYGWHRIGLRYHQTAAIVDGAVKYTLTYTLYVDGVKVNEVETDPNRFIKDGYLLYLATIDPEDNTKLIYTDNTQDKKHFTMIRRDAFFGAESERWMILGDIHVTSGHEFVLDVEPVETPEAATFTPKEGATELPASFYYKLAD